MCQCERTGLLAIRVDLWEIAAQYNARLGVPVPQIQMFDRNRIRDQHPGEVFCEEDEKAIAYSAEKMRYDARANDRWMHRPLEDWPEYRDAALDEDVRNMRVWGRFPEWLTTEDDVCNFVS